MIRSMTGLVRSSPSLPLIARSSGEATRIGTRGAAFCTSSMSAPKTGSYVSALIVVSSLSFVPN